MGKILAVRHAESIANTKGIYQGQSYDTGLSPLGKKQAKALAERFVSGHSEFSSESDGLIIIDSIISSPLKRTAETAKAVSQKAQVEVETNKAIIETDHGEWEGKNVVWIKQNYPEVLEVWQTKPSKANFPYGEKFTETMKRVNNFVMTHEWKGTALLVTHDNIVRVMVCMAKNWPIDKLWKFDLEPVATTEFEIEGVKGTKELKLIKLNDTEHLTQVHSDLSVHAL